MTNPVDVSHVEALLAAAATTCRRWREPDARFLRVIASMWPAESPTEHGRYKAVAARVQPSEEAIDELLATLKILASSVGPRHVGESDPIDSARIIWLRACGYSWKHIIRLRRLPHNAGFANARHSLRKAEKRGLELLAKHLSRHHATHEGRHHHEVRAA